MTFSDSFLIQVGLHQDLVPGSFSFMIVLEVLSRKIRSGYPKKLLYAVDLALVSETLEDLEGRLEAWKGALESEWLRVNVKKAKIMINSESARKVKIESKFPCTVCRKGVGRNSILSQFCRCWLHKRCSGIRGKLKEDSKFKC